MSKTMVTYALCHSCAQEITESIDSDGRNPERFDTEQDWLEDIASRDASIEAMGCVAHVESRDIGCFTCFVCSDVDYGEAEIFEGSDNG